MSNYPKVYRANCRCGWQSSWATTKAWATLEARKHQDNDQHLVFVSWGEYTNKTFRKENI